MWAGILLSVLFLALCGGILAALLVWAEKRILNYGICKIEINGGKKTLEVPGGSSLLSSLADHNIFIPSACGGRGSCAYCKLRVLDGAGMIGPVEEPYLSDDERREQVRLSCQVKVRNDLRIEIPDELFSVRRYQARVLHKRPLTHDIIELRLELLEPSEIQFTAGQYMQIESDEYKGHDSVMRAYSLSSVPSETRHVEFIIRRVPDGILTTWMFDVVQEGQTINLSGPYGHFQLSGTEAPILCIAGGSGMAPIWSIVRDMREKNITRETTYFFGALTQRDLFFVEELQALEKECPWFHFVPALSNEPADSGWTGERGLITDVVHRHFPDTSRHESYLCGSPGMIDAAIKVLVRNGMAEANVYYDKFA